MSAHDDGQSTRVLETAFGALTDWLEAVRVHENERRSRQAAAEIARRNQSTIAVMALLSAVTIAFFLWLSRQG